MLLSTVCLALNSKRPEKQDINR